ncbi:bifunctional [glutamate--ammonia ligase]-adenylyl-L-tyrosine phosphorylase/[glutamate--ammonia-ligase] adenylyltransferase [Marinomonas algicola]|uniref:bifunctional [glutamate--ammonia ligase]-adenylyl-L-tyrosine phosphorylase/[glutamate--ammonia-ligase] adenylyltransferase n=1 Tax=Marinomonas algicola TaxID=2773454 RepID=UPI001EFEFFE0|nr:bifunctional [glutamate--ammonia ligase]-adenylyl-L-tyrosine phosphorylase/[glutamate--ammonia-ligase] adenylyltransferase [Marinomonas algicola]
MTKIMDAISAGGSTVLKTKNNNAHLIAYAQAACDNKRLLELQERYRLQQLPQLTEEVWEQINGVICVSEYVFLQLLRHPKWIENLVHITPETMPSPSVADLLTSLDNPLEMDEKALMSRLRLVRQYCMVCLIFLDVRQAISLKKLTNYLTLLADACVNASILWIEHYYLNLYGRAMDAEGNELSLIVIGMGKLGGGELNLSSDIDLIFAFREHGDTQGGKKTLSNQEYFTKIGQKLIQHLDVVNADGFVFRVDMRLRPFGQSGALVLNLDSLENYYQDQGRDWERYAMIKARVMAGNPKDVKAFEALRKPFVFRKYLDFSAISALRDLKNMIEKEVQRKGIEHNIKLGEGGIREIEFIVQAIQILHGGRDTRLQTQSLYQVLPYLAEQGYLTQLQVDSLWNSYCLLRRVEHALQGVRDEQTQLLPTETDERELLAAMLGFDSWQSLDSLLWQQRKRVHAEFIELIEEDSASNDTLPNVDSWRVLFKKEISRESIEELTCEVNWKNSDTAIDSIQRFVSSRGVVFMQPIGQDRLANFFASFMLKLETENNPDLVSERVLVILEAILRRTSYLVLLCENPTAITHLIRLCRESAWFSESISTTPMLLDELLDANTLFSPPDKYSMEEELRQILLRLPEEDEEAKMDAMRRFKLSLTLRIAACDITDVLPLMKVSDHLTWLAEVLLEQVMLQAWHYLTQRHGYPTDEQNNPVFIPQLVIVGYGKSGGWELGYDSDLDLVFLHNANQTLSTDGERSVDNLTFYTRLGQRIIHLLNSFTASGRLYEVDMRLRPSGNSGLLVSSLTAFSDYQQKEAWVWEHQALTRARALAGHHDLVSTFDKVRAAVLSSHRDVKDLKAEVIKMREKMRAHLDSAKQGLEFDIKQGRGGIIDIEFMVQYLILAHAHAHPELLAYSDNIRQLEAAADVGVISPEHAERLAESYKLYRSCAHRLTLQKQGRVVPKEALLANQETVSCLWRHFVEKSVL